MDLIDEQKNNSVEYACNLINTAIKEFIKNNYSMSENLLKEALPTLKDNRDSANFALCLALQGVLLYIKDKSNYQEALSVISDAKYLATYLDDKTVRIFVEFVLGFIYKSDKNYELAKLSFDCAKNLAFKNDELNLLNVINENLTELQSISNGLLANRADPLVALVKISQSISAETNIDQLIKTIAEETKEAIQADRCTVFLYDEGKNEIWSKVALGLENSEIRFPADKGLAGHCVKTGETINIKDAYNDPRFNPEIDLKTGYKTKTIL